MPSEVKSLDGHGRSILSHTRAPDRRWGDRFHQRSDPEKRLPGQERPVEASVRAVVLEAIQWSPEGSYLSGVAAGPGSQGVNPASASAQDSGDI